MSSKRCKMTEADISYMKAAIEEAMNSKSEAGKVSPRVGVVVVKDEKVLAKTHRGAFDPKEHAEFTALERILENTTVAGATVYTTLEPCTTRNHPKLPCARHLIERKVGRVVIGMLDPNPAICGRGVRMLQSHNIIVNFFPTDLLNEIEEHNRAFRRAIETKVERPDIDSKFVARNAGRSIDEWYEVLNYVYADRNFYRDPLSIFAHLVEVIGGLSQLASGKKKPGKTPESFLPKAIAWWFALCGKLGVRSVSELLWTKFPGVCPYCQRKEHDSAICAAKKKESLSPDWTQLRELGQGLHKPTRLSEWQRMFRRIYKPSHKPDFEATFARLTEELGELAEAVRVFPAAPGYFLSEAADVFAWLMNIQNNVDYRDEKPEANYGNSLEDQFCRSYPDYCPDCSKLRCVCPPILESTIGRIAHEVPTGPDLFENGGLLMTPDKARVRFGTID